MRKSGETEESYEDFKNRMDRQIFSKERFHRLTREEVDYLKSEFKTISIEEDLVDTADRLRLIMCILYWAGEAHNRLLADLKGESPEVMLKQTIREMHTLFYNDEMPNDPKVYIEFHKRLEDLFNYAGIEETLVENNPGSVGVSGFKKLIESRAHQ